MPNSRLDTETRTRESDAIDRVSPRVCSVRLCSVTEHSRTRAAPIHTNAPRVGRVRTERLHSKQTATGVFSTYLRHTPTRHAPRRLTPAQVYVKDKVRHGFTYPLGRRSMRRARGLPGRCGRLAARQRPDATRTTFVTSRNTSFRGVRLGSGTQRYPLTHP